MKEILTFCAVFRNEAPRVRSVLDIAKGLCSDMVLVVQKSEDKTLKICKEYTNNIIEHPSQSPEESKDAIMKKLNTPWSFWLDADEFPSLNLIHWLESFSIEILHGYDSVWVPRINYVDGIIVKGGQEDDRQPKLLRSDCTWEIGNRETKIHIHPICYKRLNIPYPIYHNRTFEKIVKQTQRWNELCPQTADMCNKYVEDVKRELDV